MKGTSLCLPALTSVMKRMHSRNMKSLWFSFTTFSSTKCRGSRLGWSRRGKRQQGVSCVALPSRAHVPPALVLPPPRGVVPIEILTQHRAAPFHLIPRSSTSAGRAPSKLPRVEKEASGTTARTLLLQSCGHCNRDQCSAQGSLLSPSFSNHLCLQS